ncbi:HD domain-containing phosphohydrolase [Stenotrophomonas maltophilia]|uniref:HD domain-containing phosphohydrolase n=1 Tax=Stenotrophomonas maltophilia TaxID=40324 RepID=UPI0034DB39EB
MNAVSTSDVPVLDVIRALAFVGDLAMGQPTDHSPRAAWLAGQLAQASGADGQGCMRATVVALLRWSGCTANAPEFSQLFGDDVGGRQALLALRSPGSGFRSGTRGRSAAFHSLSTIHCEVSGDIALRIGLDDDTQFALRHLFECHDGSGAPGGLQGAQVPAPVYTAAIAGDLEVFHRLHGLDAACRLIEERAGRVYPPDLVRIAVPQASRWIAALDSDPGMSGACSLGSVLAGRTTSLELLADVIDLKLPWMTGYSRAVATYAQSAAANLGLDDGQQQRLYRAGLIHGIGRAAIPNRVWNCTGTLSGSHWEQVRLAPYWTGRAGRQIGSLAPEARIASHAYERSDGSGYFRELGQADTPLEARILAAAVAWVALRQARPWREAFTDAGAQALLAGEAQAGRYDLSVVQALLQPRSIARPARHRAPTAPLLTERERDVLQLISLGASNKRVAQKLGISPSTVRTHVESVFRKLECSTRAAATLKAAQLGVI